jgi:predicted lipoprotein
MTRYQRLIKIIVSSLIGAAVIYFSIYFKPLDKVLEERQLKTFKSDEYARHYWNDVLTREAKQAVDAAELVELLRNNPDLAFNSFGKTMGISDMSNILLKGRGQVTLISDDFIELRLCNSQSRIKLKTGMIFGNILRDCTGRIKMGDFKNSMDFNNISLEINKIVNTEIIPELKQKVKQNDFIYFEGATGILKGSADPLTMEIIPVRINIIDDC